MHFHKCTAVTKAWELRLHLYYYVGSFFTTGNTHPAASLVSKPDMINLRRLSTHAGAINIMQETAPRYRDIGILLLNDRSGAIVDGIKETARGDPVAAVDMIYTRWIGEDVDYSWEKLTQCFRDCDLNSLACDIEQHFGLQQSMLQYLLLCMAVPRGGSEGLDNPPPATGEGTHSKSPIGVHIFCKKNPP